MKTSLKVQCLHPEGKRAPAIAAETYALFEKAIYHALKGKKGISFTALTEAIDDCFAKQKTRFEGSTGWYAVHVKNHLQATGIIKTFVVKGKKLHALA